MKGGHNKKSVRVEFVMSEAEAELVKERMAELGITNLSAYLRKMAVDGYIIHLDMGDIQEMIRLLRICSNNLLSEGLFCPCQKCWLPTSLGRYSCFTK